MLNRVSQTTISTAIGLLLASTIALADEKSAVAKGAGSAAAWQPQGPAPITDSVGVEGNSTDGEIEGAVHIVAPHPTQLNVLYAGSVNGGIWRTDNAQAASPNWVRQTDNLGSLSIGDISFDPAVANGNTLVAGVARRSSFGGEGGALIGVLRTTNGGTSWSVLPDMANRSISGVVANGSVIVAGVDFAEPFACSATGIFRSVDSGQSFSRVTNGFPGGLVDALVQDPTDPDTLYASVVFANTCNPGTENGIYKSQNGGEEWFKSSPLDGLGFALQDALTDSLATNVKMSIGNDDNLYVVAVPGRTQDNSDPDGTIGAIVYTLNGGDLWFEMNEPGSFEPSFFGVHPGGQGDIHLSISADPLNENFVYIGGDRQPSGDDDEDNFATMPNSLGARSFSGRLFRGDVTNTSTGDWFFLTHAGTAGNSSPHADSRSIAFAANGVLFQSDDGGVYRRTQPRSTAGNWFSANGNLQTTEIHSGSYDPFVDVFISGNQDNSFTSQLDPDGLEWIEELGGDGGDTAVGREGNLSVRYGSAQTLLNFARARFNVNNVFQDWVFPDLTPLGGADPIDPQFVNPIEVNNVDNDRMLFGGANGVYESLDRGDTVSLVGPNVVALADGGRPMSYGANGNASVIYVAGCIGVCRDETDGADGIYRRRNQNDPLEHIFPNDGAGIGFQIAVDESDPSRAYFIEDGRVWQLTGYGSNFTDITGGLLGLNPGTLKSLAFLSNGAQSTVVVGSDLGVYAATAASGFSDWQRFGTGLPNAIVKDLDFDLARNKLVAFTLGRGAFSLSPVFGALPDIVFSDGFE